MDSCCSKVAQGLQKLISMSINGNVLGRLTLIHLLTLSIGRVRVTSGVPIALLIHLVDPSRVLNRSLSLRRRIADGWQVWTDARRIVRAGWSLCRILRLAIDTIGTGDSALTFLVGFARGLLLLLASLPLLADFFKLYRGTALAPYLSRAVEASSESTLAGTG